METIFNPFDVPAGASAMQSVVLKDFADWEDFDRRSQWAERLLLAIKTGGTVQEQAAARLRSYWTSASKFNRETWDAEKWPWSGLPRENEPHRVAANYHDAVTRLVMEIAAAAGLIQCERLNAAGDVAESAWNELDTALRRLANPHLFPESMLSITTLPPQVTFGPAAVAITEDAAHYLTVLWARFGERLSDREVIAESEWLRGMYGERPRFTQLRDALPNQVKAWLDTNNTGTKMCRPS